MSDDAETVYVLPYNAGRESGPMLHFERDCQALERSDREPIEKERHVLPAGRRVCSWCQKAKKMDSRPLSVREAQARKENRQAVYDALREAGCPLTRREIELEAMLSKKPVLRVLRDLEDLGQIEQVDNPEDGRKPRYRLRTMSTESPTRQRAVVDVRAIALLTVTVGFLYVVASAIASGVTLG